MADALKNPQLTQSEPNQTQAKKETMAPSPAPMLAALLLKQGRALEARSTTSPPSCPALSAA